MALGINGTLGQSHIAGRLDKFLEFGYVSSPIVFAIYAAMLWAGIRLILTERARINIFPFAILSVILVVNITESNFMTKRLSTVLTSIAIGLILQQKQSTRFPIRSIASLLRRRQVDLA